MPGDIFDQLPFFEGLSPDQLELLRPLFIPCDCYSGTVLFEQGDLAADLFIVIVGEVTIEHKPDDAPPITITRVRPGGVVGWSAALGNREYTSSAICSTYSQMLRVRGADLRNLCEQHPDTGILILERLAAVIAERLSNTHDQVMALLQQGLGNGTKGLQEAKDG